MNLARRFPLTYIFWQVCLLRQGPQVMPASRFLLGLLVAASLLLAVADFSLGVALPHALAQAIGDLLITVMLAYLFLRLAGREARFVQTLTAMLGSGLIMSLAAFPGLVMMHMEPQWVKNLAAVVLYLLFFWNILIIGHIFRHALETSMSIGILIAVGYFFLAILMFYFIFPAG